MAETPRTQDAMNQDPTALRRRARRRLVGAIAIALIAILVVPLLFDPDPKPLGSDVDIRIPAQETPFEPVTPPLAPAAEAPPAPHAAEPTPSSPPPQAAAQVPHALPLPSPGGAQAVPDKAVAEAKPAAPKQETKQEAKAVPKLPPKAEAKPEPRPVVRAEQKPVPEPAFASKGYYLQLGAFGNAANADSLAGKVRAAGFKVETSDSNGQHRVRVGPIQDRDKAQETLSRLKAKGFSPVMIGP